ncbi:hypothetical protein B7463_g10067, partial [Scytalidium lignicola]
MNRFNILTGNQNSSVVPHESTSFLHLQKILAFTSPSISKIARMDASVNEVIMDNSGCRPLQVPGFGGIPIDYVLKCEDRFAHGIKDWRQVPAVTARELAMVAVMNTLTDKPEWHVDIFNDQIVANWCAESVTRTPLISEKAWVWCLNELRDKAVHFSKTQYVRVLDTGLCICKSDILIPESVNATFKSGIAPLLEQPVKDWQPKSNGQVLNLVDPSLFPLVYGRSLVLTDGKRVDLKNVFDSYEHATTALKQFDKRVDFLDVQRQIEQGASETRGIYVDFYNSKREFYYWSYNYQCLPFEVEFLEDFDTEVHITSYINNLHPTHKLLYRSIEKLISLTIKPWNDCLVQGQQGWEDYSNQGQRGPVPLRIITYGVEWENELPEWALAFNIPASSRVKRYLKAQEVLQNTTENETEERKKTRIRAQGITGDYGDVRDKINMKRPTPELYKVAKEYLELPENRSNSLVKVPEDWAESEQSVWFHIVRKHDRLMHFKHPEPGTAFSYEDWKTGNNNKAIIHMVTERPEYDNFKPVIPDHKSYKVALQDTFRKKGLQIIVKIDSIELTPENSKYSGSNWKLDGQMNEHIVAVALYSYDVQNVTETRVSFRQETPIYECFYKYATERFTREKYNYWNRPAHRYNKTTSVEIAAIAEILGFRENDLRKETIPVQDILPFQNIGSVITPQGRLITFPNIMEHRVEPFELIDPNLPGHYRSVKLYLVDPHYRVCSTRNVPPQQHDWWAQAMSDEFLKLKVPREISTEITDKTADWPMSIKEAREHRLEMMKQHRWKDMARYGSAPRYGFW